MKQEFNTKTIKDYASYFLLQNKAYKISMSLTTMIGIALMILIEVLFPNGNVSDSWILLFIKNSLELMTIMILTSVSGYAVGSISALIMFASVTLTNGFVYQPVLLMIASVVSNFPVVHQWYKKKSRTVLSAVLFAIVLGAASNIIVLFLENNAIDNFILTVKEQGLFSFYTLGILLSGMYILPCALVSLFCYVFFNFVPLKYRKLFFSSSYESEEVKAIKATLAKNKKKGSIGKTVFTIVVVEAVFMAVAAFGFSGGLIVVTFGVLESEAMILFMSRMFFLMMMIAVPTIFVAVANINTSIINPIKLMAKAIEDSSRVSVDRSRNMDNLDIHDLNIKSQNEIGVLYDSLVFSADSTKAYLERMQKEQELKHNLQVAEEANKAKSAFLSNMSHEIRTPINAMLGFDEMILRESSEPEILRYASDIQGAGKSLLSLVNEILDFSKVEAGKMEIIPVEYDLSSTINDSINMISKRAEDKGLALNVSVDENIPHLLYGDEIRIKQCVINILTNAVKYTEKGSINFSFTYEKTSDSSIDLTIHVKDTGIGIKEEDLGKLFTAFQRLDEKRNRTIEGTGLGMNLVQHLLGLMGTVLKVDSVYGEGSDFYFTLSQQVINWEPIGNFTEKYIHAKESFAGARYKESFHAPDAHILVTDDTQLNLTVIRGLLKQTKIQVDTATSGAETLKLCAQKKYDIIFIDHRMPVMDGIETLKALTAMEDNLNKGVPCIALTANAVSGARQMYLNEGFTEYLTKPIDSKKLEHLILEYLPKEKVEQVSGDDSGPDNNERPSAESPHAALLEKIKNVEGIDLSAGIKNCGDEQVFLDALKEFYRSIKEKSELIEKYADGRDFKNYTVLVHALKSSARLVGAQGLSGAAAHLEKCGDEMNENEIAEKTPALLSEYREYGTKLSFLSQDEQDDGKEEIGAEDFSSALSNIRECIQAFDFTSADQIIEMLGEYKIPADQKERFEKIKKAIALVDQNEAMSLLSEIK